MILILSASWDSHAKKVYELIKQKGCESQLFLTDQYSKSNYIKLHNNLISIVINNKELDIRNITSLLVRHPYKWENITKDKDDIDCLREEFNHTQVNDIVKAFINESSINGSFVINTFDTLIEYKLSNLLRGQEVGFTIPETIIGNAPEIFSKLSNKCSYIIKPFVCVTAFGKRTLTRNIKEVSKKEIINMVNTYNINFPYQVQKKIEKQFDLRITVVGNQIYPCAIYSQENPLTLLDFRNADYEKIRHESYKLPKDIADKCLEICRRNNLNYSAIDMALDKNGKYVFFELNPYGEYLWIEEKTGLPISEGMANLLMYPDKYRLV